jgi:amidase
MPNIETIASPYGFGQPSDTPDMYGQLAVYFPLLAVAYGEWLQNWTYPANDTRYNMSTLTEMAAWNDAHNSTTGSLGNSTWWYNTVTGQDFYDYAMATNGTLGSAFWTAFGWGRTTAAAAIDGGFAFTTDNGTVLEMDGLLVPSGNTGGSDNACASIPSYAGYPAAGVPIGQNGYSIANSICVYGRKYGEAKLVSVASAMEDLFQWTADPQYYNYKTAAGIWETPFPGYACTEESLDRYACDSA